MSAQIDKLKNVLSDAIKTPSPGRPLRRHRDDDYIDRIEITALGVSLDAYIRPRFKTSGLSGNEWRISTVLEIRPRPHLEDGVFVTTFHSMRRLLEYAPFHIYTSANDLLSCPKATLVAYRKGHVLFSETRPTFGEAAIGLSWLCVTANEGRKGVEWHHVSDTDERTHCQQVGCSEPPVNVYHLKQIDEGKSGGHMVTPKYDFEGQFTWYCARHSGRGDSSFEDCDTNLELVDGLGLHDVREEDESPAVTQILRFDGADK